VMLVPVDGVTNIIICPSIHLTAPSSLATSKSSSSDPIAFCFPTSLPSVRVPLPALWRRFPRMVPSLAPPGFASYKSKVPVVSNVTAPCSSLLIVKVRSILLIDLLWCTS
jgi:hypothetical protein